MEDYTNEWQKRIPKFLLNAEFDILTVRKGQLIDKARLELSDSVDKQTLNKAIREGWFIQAETYDKQNILLTYRINLTWPPKFHQSSGDRK